MAYKFLEHTADIKIAVEEKNLEKAFESAAMALKNVILRREKIKIKEKIKKKIKVSGKDREALLYNFLEEFLYLFDAENFMLSSVKNIKINQDSLEADVFGDKINEYNICNEVKAITYNEMDIKILKNGKAKIQFVLDV